MSQRRTTDTSVDEQSRSRGGRPPEDGANVGGQASENIGEYPEAEPSLGYLATTLTEDLSTLFRKEIQLARAEMRETVSRAVRGASFLAIGGAIAYAGAILLLMGLSILLGQWLDNFWLSTMIVGAVVLIVGALLLLSGQSKLKNMDLSRSRTVETVKDDARWAKEQIK